MLIQEDRPMRLMVFNEQLYFEHKPYTFDRRFLNPEL